MRKVRKGIIHFLEWIGLHPKKDEKISTEQVKSAYRLFLDREPESDEAITSKRINPVFCSGNCAGTCSPRKDFC